MIIAPRITANELIPGDILCFNKASWIAYAIQAFTRSKYGHVGCKGTDGLIYEALEQGYTARLLKESIDSKTRQVVVKRLKTGLDIDILDACNKKMLGVRYEFEGTILFQPIEIFTGEWLGDKEVTKDVFCSKAEAYKMAMMGIEPYVKMWYEAQPGDFAEDCLNFDTFILDLKTVKKL